MPRKLTSRQGSGDDKGIPGSDHPGHDNKKTVVTAHPNLPAHRQTFSERPRPKNSPTFGSPARLNATAGPPDRSTFALALLCFTRRSTVFGADDWKSNVIGYGRALPACKRSCDRAYSDLRFGSKSIHSALVSDARHPKADIFRHRSEFLLWANSRQKRAAAKKTYSITSSAIASTPGGMARPNASAVLRLSASTNFVGWSTGNSEGFAPLMIRAA